MGKLFLITGDYIKNSKGMDAIVNAQNKYMSYGSGICGVIYRAAGVELQTYCKNNYNCDMEVGEVRITPGFDLKMDIIHVLAPKAFEEKEPIEKLIETYKNVLEAIKNKKYKNVLFNSLGTGIHGYRHSDVAKSLVKLLIDFCNESDVNIYLNNMYPIHKDEYLKELFVIKKLLVKRDLKEKSLVEIKRYLENNNLIDTLIDDKYFDFVDGKEIEDMCLSEKLLYLQYSTQNNIMNNSVNKIIESI